MDFILFIINVETAGPNIITIKYNISKMYGRSTGFFLKSNKYWIRRKNPDKVMEVAPII